MARNPDSFSSKHIDLVHLVELAALKEKDLTAEQMIELCEKQARQMRVEHQEYLAEIARLAAIYKIKVDPKRVLTFEDLIAVKVRSPGFFFEFKKKRTQLLKDTEAKPKEQFYQKYIREKKELQEKLNRENQRKKQIQEATQNNSNTQLTHTKPTSESQRDNVSLFEQPDTKPKEVGQRNLTYCFSDRAEVRPIKQIVAKTRQKSAVQTGKPTKFDLHETFSDFYIKSDKSLKMEQPIKISASRPS